MRSLKNFSSGVERSGVGVLIQREMDAPRCPPVPVPPEHLGLYEAAERLARKVLAARGILGDEQNEIVASYIAAAYERRSTYRAEAGTPEQWLLGVLRTEVLLFYGGQKRLARGDRILADRIGSVVPEPRAGMLRKLMSKLTDEERQVVWLCDAEGYSYTEVAGLLGVSKTTVSRRDKRAMEKMEAAGGDGPAALVLLAGWAATRPPEPSPAAKAQFWARFMERYGAKLGISHPRELFAHFEPPEDDPPENGPPDSGVSRSPDARPPASRTPKWRWLRVVGPLGGLLAAATIADAIGRGPTHDEALAASAPATPGGAPMAVAAPATAGSGTASVAEGAPGTSFPGVVASASESPVSAARRPGSGYHDSREGERALSDQWHEACVAGDVKTCCEVLARHRLRFERGAFAENRERQWNAVCAERHPRSL